MILQDADQIVERFYHDDEIPSTYPPALVKACTDYFSYAMGLKDGTVITFSQAGPTSDEWVNLYLDRETGDGGLPFPCPRGVDVRVSEIVWIADAPEGS